MLFTYPLVPLDERAGRYTISKDFAFSASHVLHGLPEGHQCGRVHGHNYVVRAMLSSATVNEQGFVMDYGDLAPFSRWIDDTLDHRHLNDVMDVQPSAENMARVFAEVLRIACKVPEHIRISMAVSETPKTWATYDA